MTLNMPALNFISPNFIVSQVQDSVSFYVDKLGFELTYMGPDDDPYFAMIGRDKVFLMLKHIEPGIHPVPNNTRHPWARWDAYISTDDPDGLYEEFSKKGVVFRETLGVNSDNLRGFEIEDADGYVLFFGRPVEAD